MNNFKAFSAIAFLWTGIITAAETSPTELLKASDRARGGLLKGLEWKVQLKTIEAGSTTEREFGIEAKGDDALIEALSPARNKGEVYLFNDRDMWFYKPGLRKPISISARQRLSGQAANGDIASTHYSRDYEGSIVGKTKIDGEPVFILDLKAKDKKVTYDRIKYYISEKSKLAMKAEFLSLEGEPFKVATFKYGNSILSSGQKIQFISRMTITDSKFAENISDITYVNPKEKDFSGSKFNINNLAR
ncbi:MAG: outer rane lipoproteinsorting protein [Bacteriovoracaceae bacterium]|nr:outer rane lipoproteinsorting protein [Bacteriovoracaceae bacterium]